MINLTYTWNVSTSVNRIDQKFHFIMKPFRDHVGIAIDGGGIRGLIVTQALAVLEEFTGQSVHDTFRLSVGTSTGSIISAGIATGLSAGKMTELYMQMGNTIFPKTLRSVLWPLTKYRYSDEPLQTALNDQFGGQSMGSLWNEGRKPILSSQRMICRKTERVLSNLGKRNMPVGQSPRQCRLHAPFPHISLSLRTVISTAVWVVMATPATSPRTKPGSVLDGTPLTQP